MDMNRYRLLSVRAEDFDTIMNWGFPSAHNGAEVISIVVEHYKQKIISDKENELQSIYYVSDEHKELFEKHLKIDQFRNYKSDNLLCFYINSFLGVYIKDPFHIVVRWHNIRAYAFLRPISYTGHLL